MSDPAIDAAQRAWAERYPIGSASVDLLKSQAKEGLGAFVIAAAREALKPIRELHRKSRLYELSVNGTCEEQGHDIFEDGTGEWCCKQCTDASAEQIYVCAACADMDSNSEWPCATAELIYATEEI